MKKIYSRMMTTVTIVVLIISVLFLYIVPETAYAASPTISIGSASVKAGDIVTIPISISDNPGITSLDFHVEYDSSVMTLKGKTNGSLLRGALFSQDFSANPYYCGWLNSFQTKNCTQNGILLTLEFQIKDTARSGNYKVCLSENTVLAYDTSLTEKRFDVVSGTVSISGADGEESGAIILDPNGTPQTSNGESGDIIGSTEDKDKNDVAAAKKSKTQIRFEAMTIKLSGKYLKVSKNVKLSWKKSDSGIKVTSYQVYRSLKKTSGFKKIAAVSKTYFNDTKLGKKKKTYYYRVRGVRKFSGKTCYTKWSPKIKVTVN